MNILNNSTLLLHKIHIILWILFFIALPWSVKFVSLLLGLLLISSLTQFYLDHKKKINNNPVGLLFITLFILIIIRFSFDEIKESLFIIEKRLVFLILPLIFIFSQTQFKNKTREKLFIFFSASCIFLTIYLFTINYFIFLQSKKQMSHIWQYSYFTRAANFHPVYFTIYLDFVFIFLLYYFLKYQKNLSFFIKILLLFCISFVFYTIIFIQARVAIISLSLVIIFFLLNFLFKKNKNRILIMLALILIGIPLIFNFTKINPSFNRFDSFTNALKERTYKWKAAWNIGINSPIFGVGPIKSKELLYYEYLKLGHDEGITRKYNSHNEYLHIFMAHGIIGLIVFLGLLFFGLLKGVYYNNFLFIGFIFIMSMFFLTENVLSTQKGIVFFTSIFCLFIYGKYED